MCEHVGAWTPFEFEITSALREQNELEIVCEDVEYVTNGFLPAIGVRWTGARGVEILSEPTPESTPVRQRSSVDGTKLLVDGRPFRVRGILHWGHYPELGRPWPSEEQMRGEIRELQAHGFNLIKFCLWIPPTRYYELCDELGMFVWQEYPVWDRPLDDPAVLAEFDEFFRNDRRYACVILRTMTCENDRVSPEVGRRLVERCHELIPGALALDNSGWLCSERFGDFHDEHIYLHNAQWKYYGRRMRGKLSKPLLLGESMCADAPPGGDGEAALAVRRYQIETLACDLPDAGYVITAIRDLKNCPLGLWTLDGRAKYTAEQWAWHHDAMSPPREIPEVAGAIIGPRKGEWKCPEYLWWSPVVEVLDASLPVDLIRRECVFDLLSGRVLSHADGTRVLVRVHDVHDGRDRRHPLVIEFLSEGQWRVVSALRHDTPVGREIWELLQGRIGSLGVPPPPEIGAVVGTSIVLEDWEMSLDERTWRPVKCDTPLVNAGRNVFEGWGTFRARVDHPGGAMTLRVEAVADYFELFIDGKSVGEAGPRGGTWDGTRDVPREFAVDLAKGEHEIVFRVRDWRGAGGMVGPVFLARDLNERVF